MNDSEKPESGKLHETTASVPGEQWRAEDFERVSVEELAQLAGSNVLENEAYFELWRRTHGLVSSLVHNRLKGQDASHTVTAFFCHKLPCVLHQYTPSSRGVGSFEAWLTTVVRNYLNDAWRREKNRRSRRLSLDDEEVAVSRRAQALAQTPPIEEALDRDHLVYFLREIMEQVLDPEDRYILKARYWDDKSAREIASELDLTEENVRVRQFRARKRLQKVCAIYRASGLL